MLIAGAWHEWQNHVPKLLAAKDFTEEKLAVVKALHLHDQGPLNGRQWAALKYADHMSRVVAVPDSVFNKLKEAEFSTKEIVELTALVSAYNMVGRFFVALDIAEANDKIPEFLR